MINSKGITVNSSIGKLTTDASGAPVAAVRMNPDRSYADIPKLLQYFINQSDNQSWERIREKIDYTYTNLDLLLGRLDGEVDFKKQVKAWLKDGRKILFKPNLVKPDCIDPITHGENAGYSACTGWPFVAALMRWFHHKLDISYHDMSIGVAGTGVARAAAFHSRY